MAIAKSAAMTKEYTAESQEAEMRQAITGLFTLCLYGSGAEGLYGHIVPIPNQDLVKSRYVFTRGSTRMP
ncbi:uncharacterized protein N7496_010758 [Penicillium cataractarum]|uniref:Uncharacterized protein n=1 Tax=Penicillium cataractarum TaxID=2100454 RepID=A0A9W9UX02_9EURO|nr:uncharacterized protein N7496_010758 [Penicillium cataractarum]KAJ5358345.1 hypothetical protein N7496_010758 [Penicillium cataractarum]